MRGALCFVAIIATVIEAISGQEPPSKHLSPTDAARRHEFFIPAGVARRVMATVPTFGTTVVGSSWFQGQIYHLHRWVNHLPNFSKMKAVGVIYTPVLDVPPQNFTNGFPGVTRRYEFFGIDYTARIWIETPGVYRFSLVSDDGADLYIDNRLIVNNDGQHVAVERTGEANLSKGVHSIHVPYYQGPKYMVALVLKVQSPGTTVFRIFSTEEFKPPADRQDWDVPPSTPVPQNH